MNPQHPLLNILRVPWNESKALREAGAVLRMARHLQQPPRGGERRLALLLAILAASTLALYASKEFEAPKVSRAATYPAHDAHSTEKVAIAADPYNTAQKASIFRLKYLDKGILPINLIVTNDGGTPISLTKMQVQLVARERHAKLSPLDPDDIYRVMTHAKRSDDVARSTNPLPFPKHKVGGLKQEDRDEVERSRFQAEAVEPNNTQSGFLFFDVSGLDNPLDSATLYITGVRDNGRNELMYFEIPLQKIQ
jgi:hypothetical protein